MKLFLSFVVCLVLAAPIVGGSRHFDLKKTKPSRESRWSGHISMEETVTISAEGWTAESKRIVQASFVNALPTLFRDDETTELDFTDDKGTGSHTYHAEETIAGRKCVTDCVSSARPQLHQVIVDEIDKVYHIEVVSPECEGTTCADDGSPAPYNSTVSVQALDEPLGTSKDVLSGTKTETGDLPTGLGKFIRTTTWHLVRTAEADVELIVTPKQYDTWLPEPGMNFTSPGSVLDVSLKLRGKNGTTTSKKATNFTLRLSNTSTEPGLTINFPVNSTNNSADLKFLKQADAIITDTASQGMTILCRPARQTADFKIGAFDGGGWTILNAEAILEDNSTVQGRLLVSNGEMDIRIPKREPNSKIAEAWLKQYENPGEMDDKDSSKGNNNNGDGFTAYEEYRGVIAENNFKRFDPQKKELGVFGTQRNFLLFKEGINWFKMASQVEIVQFDIDRREVAADGQINMNKKTAHDYDQFALHILDGGLNSGVVGRVYSQTRDPDIPANINMVVIDRDNVQSVYLELTNEARPDRIKFTMNEYLAQTVAHELGHAVNIWHHGSDITYNDTTVNTVSDSVRIFDRNRNLITRRPYSLSSIGGDQGTVESGDMSCMLNYYPYYRWGYSFGADFAHIYNQEPLLTLGKIFCKSKNGSGINATQLYFGDAARGNCLGQLKLRN
ncbi:MAG TPA: hypothetical protein VFP97_01910 [Chitinophagaceae bacterium]|nr:hypothetical protein [Chitinophagaceae bacterium]